MYMAEYDAQNGVVRLWKYVNQSLNGNGVQLGSDKPATFATGDWLEIRAVGGTITVWQNSTLLISQTDFDVTSGLPGFGLRATNQPGSIWWSGWEGGQPCNQDGNPHTPPNYSTFLPPAVGSSYTDSTYCHSVTRLSDAVGTGNDFIEVEYATQNHFNADGTKLFNVVQGPGSSFVWIQDLTGNLLRNTGFGLSSEAMWDRTDPNIIYYQNGNELRSMDVSTGATTSLRTFGYDSIHATGESDLSPNGNSRLIVGNTAGFNAAVFLASIPSGTPGTALDISGNCPTDPAGGWGGATIPMNSLDWGQVTNSSVLLAFNWFGVTWDGPHQYCSPNANAQVRLYDHNMNYTRQLAPYIGHEDVGIDNSGHEVLYMLNANDPNPPAGCDNNAVVKFDLTTAEGPICVFNGFGWTLSEHIAAPDQASNYVYVSTYFPPGLDPDPSQTGWESLWVPYANEILRIRNDTPAGNPPVVERLEHTYSRPFAPDTYNYEPRASVNKDGTKVLFNSNYGLNYKTPGTPDFYTDTYLVTP
jgi:hypothetical protein